MRNKISILLVITLVVVGVLPLIANYFLIDDILVAQQGIYRTENLKQSLISYETTLKKLSKFDPENEMEYKRKFQDVQNLKLLYGEDTYFSEAVRSTTMKYFFVLFGVSIFLSLLAGMVLSFKVNRIYVQSFDELLKEKEKSRFLNEVAKWQEVAQKIAHEIRRPLQPIRIWISQLKKSETLDRKLLDETTQAMEEEVIFLSNMVSEFSDFASVPKPKLENTELISFIQTFITQYHDIWEMVRFVLSDFAEPLSVAIDPKIFRTLLTNLVENAVEANGDQNIEIKFGFSKSSDGVVLEIYNSGRELNETERNRIFDIYYSTKTNRKTRGLGLAIVKTIALEHGGDIQCVEALGGVKFEIQLPLVKG